MHRHTRSDAGDMPSPRSSRAASFSSERPSVAGSVTFQMPSSARPPPAYIAASVASQIVTDHHNAQLRDDRHPANPDNARPASLLLASAVFSPQALNLLNGFLDNLLFAFLSAARSPSLAAIRPAITEVLKPRLAREATATADDELQGLLGGDDDEEFPEHLGQAAAKWDVEKVWKRTRLRIMVYTRLGELEDEDEERYVLQERGLSMDEDDDEDAGLVSWASAIFLTSVIEYVAEQTLLASGQASYGRMSAKLKKNAHNSEDGEESQLERIVVEDFDVEKIALNSALGRLWRTWRKRVRTPVTPLSPSRQPRSMSSLQSLHNRHISHDTIDSFVRGNEGVPELPEHKPTETEIAANIPLPISDNDVNEIEVPGLARVLDEEESSGTQTPVLRPKRPTSVIMLAPAETFRRRTAKERPVSMPSPASQPFAVPTQHDVDEEVDQDAIKANAIDVETADEEEMDFKTPMERPSDDESYIMDERQEGLYHEHDEGDPEDDADMVAFAASTGMGFGMGPASPTKSDDDDAIDTPTKTGFAMPRVLQSKRMSIEKTGPPGIVRTFSARERRSSPGQTAGSKSHAESSLPEDDLGNPDAIGVARTSNVPIPATPSPPVELAANEESAAHSQRRQPDHQGFVELVPRHAGSASGKATVRKTPSPDDFPAPQQRPVQRKEAPQVQRKEVTQPQRREVTPPKVRGRPLAALQETEDGPSKPHSHFSPPKQSQEPQRNSPVNGSPKHGVSMRSRDAPVVVAERSAKRQPLEGSPLSRTGTGDGSLVEKSTLKRVSSSSSTAKSASTSILHTGRDSDVSQTSRPRGLSQRMSEEDREREFDSLVKSEDTVKFTLTPQSMRDMDEPPIIRTVESPRPTTSSVTVYPRVNADKDNQFGSQPLPARTGSRTNGHSAAPGRPTSTKSANRKPLAREPRIQSESMRDFADFIRSTGPPAGEDRPVQPFVTLTNSATQSPNTSSTAISGLGRKMSTKQSPSSSKPSSLSGDGPSARPRIHMEPRSPAVQRSGNDDLIDFIRQGPPGQNNGQHRIPRSVAPFRSTVDSDQFNQMLDDNGNVESAYGSQVSSTSKQSANSRTGLLPAPSHAQPAYSNTPQKLSGNLSSPEPHIQRTRRRVKDPYAIDLSDDEDDDLLTALPNSARRQEESLIDFLSSADPPPANDPKPLLLNGAQLAAAKARAANHNPNPAPGPSGRNGSMRNPPAAQPALITSTVISDAPRPYKPKLQARAASANSDSSAARSATNDLADFLRTSGPPEPVGPPPNSATRKEQARRSNTRFWRKRATADMS